MPRDYYGQSSRNPRLPLLQDPIANADPEAIAMLAEIMGKTMGRNPYSQPGFGQGSPRTPYTPSSGSVGTRPSYPPLPPRGGGNPYSDPGFSQGTTRPGTGGSWDRPRPAGKAAGNTFDTGMSYGPLYGGSAPYGKVKSGPSASEQEKRRRMYGTGGSGGIAGMQPRPQTRGSLFSEGADIKIQGESDYAVQNVRDRVWSFEDLRTAAEQPIFAAQNLNISQQAAQDALSRLMAQQMWGMGTGVTGGLDLPGGGWNP